MDPKYHILYVDDEKQNLVSFRATFRKDYHIHLAQSGKEAIELLRNQTVDLIISDQRMPGMSGVELFEQILPEFPDPIRMVITGYSDIQTVINAINKGKVYYYITKPWNPDELKLIIDHALESYQLRRENKALIAEKNELLLISERQQKENILSQFETLKNQVNPHFLFNCLNALALLVHDDPDTAETFISKMTKVYRYVLDFRDKILVSLEEELRFLDNFFYLQKIRFETNLNLSLRIPDSYLSRFIPPLTLQLLLENAIKHNVISKAHPLTIEIYTEEDHLIVKNNLKLRKEREDSTGIGLQNLVKRYQYLSDCTPSFQATEQFYIARVPLLQENTLYT